MQLDNKCGAPWQCDKLTNAVSGTRGEGNNIKLYYRNNAQTQNNTNSHTYKSTQCLTHAVKATTIQYI